MSEPSILQVFVFRGGTYVGNEVFTEPEIVIGRDGDDLALDDEDVIPNHAVLSHENGKATLLKCGAGPVLVNHVEIEHTYVGARDEIQVGSHTLKIKFLSTKSMSPRPTLTAAPSPSTPGTGLNAA